MSFWGNLSVARNRSVSLAELSLEEFGLACHVGVQVEIPTLGVSKNLLHVDGIEKNQAYRDKVQFLKPIWLDDTISGHV